MALYCTVVIYKLSFLWFSLAANPKRARLFHDKSLTNEDTYEPFLSWVFVQLFFCFSFFFWALLVFSLKHCFKGAMGFYLVVFTYRRTSYRNKWEQDLKKRRKKTVKWKRLVRSIYRGCYRLPAVKISGEEVVMRKS